MSNSLQGARMERNVIPFDPREQPVLPSDPAPPEHLMTPESIARAKAAQAAERNRAIAQVRREQFAAGHLLIEQLTDSRLREEIAQRLADADQAERGQTVRPDVSELPLSDRHDLQTAAALGVRWRRRIYQRLAEYRQRKAIAAALSEFASHKLNDEDITLLSAILSGCARSAFLGVLVGSNPATPTEYAAATLHLLDDQP